MDEDISNVDELDNESSVTGKTVASSVGNRGDIKLLNMARIFVTATMFTVAFITGNVVFVIATIRQETEFRNNLMSHSVQLIDNFHEQLKMKIVSGETLSSDLTLHSQTIDAVWPLVTFPAFDFRCAGHQEISQATSFIYSPLVTSTSYNEWKFYSEEYIVRSNAAGSENNQSSHDMNQFENGRAVIDWGESEEGYYFPLWQTSPSKDDCRCINFDQMSNQVRGDALREMVQRTAAVFADVLFGNSNHTDCAYYTTPHSVLYYPIFSNVDRRKVVGALGLEFEWKSTLEHDLDNVNDPLVVVLENSCGRNFSFQVAEGNVDFLGLGDLHDEEVMIDSPDPISSTYASFSEITTAGKKSQQAQGYCDYRITVFPSYDYREAALPSTPEVYRWLVLFLFIFTISVFVMYDCLVDRHEKRMVESAARTNEIVSSLFPRNVRDRLFKSNAAKKRRKMNEWYMKKNQKHNGAGDSEEAYVPFFVETPKRRLTSFLSSASTAEHKSEEMTVTCHSEPIADFFPNATVMFADIAGFTAWSSERDPSEVFRLLETLYQSMDKIAGRLGVFKVETIGDCYVAATGLPDQRDDHAEIMVKYARICLMRNSKLTMSLETNLGPGTSDLGMRFGVHSGPVTAGVLRGEKSRFQLFGDTMNTASRMESTGVKNKIHLSTDTAQLLISRGKSHWVVERDVLVTVKGKGDMQTYWLQVGSGGSSRTGGSSCLSINSESSDSGEFVFCNDMLQNRFNDGAEHHDCTAFKSSLDDVLGQTKLDSSLQRLVDWNTDVLLALLKKVVAGRRHADGEVADDQNETDTVPPRKGRSFLDEVEMVIQLPEFDGDAAKKVVQNNVHVPFAVKVELRKYVACIASGYRKNPFHNFEHASHVILSATKLMKRIVTPNWVGPEQKEKITTEDIHQHTYGISSDPLTQFAVVFSALVHDVGHTGVPNGQLAQEDPEIAAKYVHKSIAEQRSIDVALELLSFPDYTNLRNCIHRNDTERKRFRQLLVNSVMATDIFDKELKTLRNSRWDAAFHGPNQEDDDAALLSAEGMNRKATIVIEHIIQASDVSHTMQHWHIYQNWNERLFHEMYAAYESRRSEKDPSKGWYEGELWFFDNYVIPLARKLEECGVFGVSSDEYLTYALQNRAEWERKGKEICGLMLDHYHEHKKAKKKRAVISVDIVEEGSEGSNSERPASLSQK